jgi:Family of unknown function (DUF5317)/Transmembrane secretion effector
LLLVAAFAVVLVTVPLAGGRLSALADLTIRRVWALGLALGLQVVVVYVWPEGPGAVLAALHVASYFAAGWFVVGNGHIPGWWLIALGGLMNFAAIAANSGVMPASSSAVASAGLGDVPGRFANSAVVAEPKIAWLGDVFAVPAGWPLANVFSAGDVLLVAGGTVALHGVCRSRLAATGAGEFTGLLAERAFVRLWFAHVISSFAQWAIVVAVVSGAAEGNALVLVPVLVAVVGGAVLGGILGGPLLDRVAPGRSMAAVNLARAAAVATAAAYPDPLLLHLCVVTALLGAGEALWRATVGAAVPEIATARRVVAANALLSGAFCSAVIAGPALGAVVVAAGGRTTLALLVAGAFVASSAFTAGLQRGPGRRTDVPERSPRGDLAAGLRHARASRVVRGVLVVAGLMTLAAAGGVPPIIDAIATRSQALGPASGAWTLGVALGAAAVPAAASRWRPERLLPAGIAVLGVGTLGASQASAASSLAGLWLVAGCGVALATICCDSLLQECTPDPIRGRVLALGSAVGSGGLLAGVAFASGIEALAGGAMGLAASGALVFVAAAASVALVSAPPAAPARSGAARTATSAPSGAGSRPL